MIVVRITKAGRYTAVATPPHLKVGEHWVTASPMDMEELATALKCRGAHPVDVYDAIHEAELCWNMT